MTGGRRAYRRARRARLACAGAAALAILAAIAVAAGALAARERLMLDSQLIFFPDRDVSRTPMDVDLRYEDAWFTAADGARLHGWFVPAAGGESADTLVWFHGNAGNIGDRIDNLLLISRRLDVSVFIFDYRGYGRSGGKPSERGLYADGEAALAYLRDRGDVDMSRLTLFGRSLGCAVVVELATRHPVKAVILESPFTSIDAMARRMRGGIAVLVPTSWVVRSKFDSLSKIGNVHSPVMLLHGDMDDIVPIEMGHELFAAANDPKRFYPIRGAGHNDTVFVGDDAYFAALKEFISQH